MHTTAEIHAKEMLIRILQTQASLMKKVAQVAEEIYGPTKKPTTIGAKPKNNKK